MSGYERNALVSLRLSEELKAPGWEARRTSSGPEFAPFSADFVPSRASPRIYTSGRLHCLGQEGRSEKGRAIHCLLFPTVDDMKPKTAPRTTGDTLNQRWCQGYSDSTRHDKSDGAHLCLTRPRAPNTTVTQWLDLRARVVSGILLPLIEQTDASFCAAATP